MQEQEEIEYKNSKILINIDFTSDRNDFLILLHQYLLEKTVQFYYIFQCVIIQSTRISIIKNKWHKQMEIAFIKALIPFQLFN